MKKSATLIKKEIKEIMKLRSKRSIEARFKQLLIDQGIDLGKEEPVTGDIQVLSGAPEAVQISQPPLSQRPGGEVSNQKVVYLSMPYLSVEALMEYLKIVNKEGAEELVFQFNSAPGLPDTIFSIIINS